MWRATPNQPPLQLLLLLLLLKGGGDTLVVNLLMDAGAESACFGLESCSKIQRL